MASSTKRHPARLSAKAVATADGIIKGYRLQGDFNTGAYASWGPTVAGRVPAHCCGPYNIENVFCDTRAVHTGRKCVKSAINSMRRNSRRLAGSAVLVSPACGMAVVIQH